MREVVRKRVVDSGIGVEGLLGGGEVDALRQLDQVLATSVEANEQLSGDVPVVAGRVRSTGAPGRNDCRGKAERGCGNQRSPVTRCPCVNTAWREKFLVKRGLGPASILPKR
jgi:hypothetical protein